MLAIDRDFRAAVLSVQDVVANLDLHKAGPRLLTMRMIEYSVYHPHGQ